MKLFYSMYWVVLDLLLLLIIILSRDGDLGPAPC